MDFIVNNELCTDILIVGGGLAGIKAAYECGKSNLKVTVAVKSFLCSGSSFYPLMNCLGCQAPLDDDKDKINFLQEIEESSYGMNDTNLCSIYINEIRERVKELPQMGIEYRLLGGGRIPCFAKRPRDIFIWENWNVIRNNVRRVFNNMQNLHVIEGMDIISLVVKNNKIVGAVGIDSTNNFVHIKTNAVILATGGFGDLYKHSLNTEDVSGSGHILALDAGARLINMEFIQFIPGFITPLYKTVVSEQTFIYCNKIVDGSGVSILSKYLPKEISERMCIEERAKHGPFTSADISRYFDIAMMNEILASGKEDGFRLTFSEKIHHDKRDFIRIYVDWLKDKGIDIVKDEIHIAPFAHASNGGIYIDENCCTGVDGLFAAGEAAGGIHGADRHGGNASGSCLVFGKRAADSAVKYAKENMVKEVRKSDSVETILNKFHKNAKSELKPENVLAKVREIMWLYGNVVRSEANLEKALNQISELNKQYNPVDFFSNKSNVRSAVKAQQFLDLSAVLLKVMLIRKESRGSHYRVDYPDINTVMFNKRITIYKAEDGKETFDFI